MENSKNQKYVVIKQDDLIKYLSWEEFDNFTKLLVKVNKGREKNGKSTDNYYMVINSDELYSEDVLNIMKQNGHWN